MVDFGAMLASDDTDRPASQLEGLTVPQRGVRR